MDKTNFSKWYDRYYKFLLLIPLILILFSIIYLGVFESKNGDFIHKDVSLTGGTTITLFDKIDKIQLEQALFEKLEDFNLREISDLITREQKAIIITTKESSEKAKQVLEEYLGHDLTNENSSIEFTGASLSASFYKQLLFAIVFAFILMALIVFIVFRTIVPSTAVIISAFADILMTLVTADILGIKMSSAGIIAFLMLIGYSVDTDILLTTRMLKRQGPSNEKLFGAFKTGITMALTSLLAISIALIIVKPFSVVLAQIFTILLIGLIFDIFNTWITNASLIKWHAESK